MSSPPAGWYANPEDSTQLRYWDGSEWTDHTSPAQQASTAPPVSGLPGQMPLNLYEGALDLTQVLDDEQRRRYMQHTLTRFPTWLAIVLHILTFGLFSLIYQGLKFSKLPLAKHDDFTAGKGIGFMFIPFFNIYWTFRYALGLSDRLNFQFRLRGQHPPVSRDLALAASIVQIIPYVNLIIGFLILGPIVVGQWQSATNRLVAQSQPAMPPPPPPELTPPENA